MNQPFYMLKMSMDQRKLLRIGSRRALRENPLDLGYLVHSALGETFGDEAPSPFTIESVNGARLSILAYGPLSAASCMERLPSSTRSYILPESIEARKMPDQFAIGVVYEFRLRACPVIRKARGAGEDAGKELDVYRAAVEKAGSSASVNRDSVYVRWVRELFERSAGVRSVEAHVLSRRMSDVIRRKADRSAKKFGRPDVAFEGRLIVEDGGKLRVALQTGLGRHKAFGFGMLCLRRPR